MRDIAFVLTNGPDGVKQDPVFLEPVIRLGWDVNRSANSADAVSPSMAASATFAFRARMSFGRLRRVRSAPVSGNQAAFRPKIQR